MNSTKIITRRKTLKDFGENKRPPKKQKADDTTTGNVFTVLSDIGASKFSRGDYRAAEECFSQALCRIDIGHLCFQVGSHVAKISTSDSHKNDCSTTDTTEKTSSTSTSGTPQQSKIEYDEGMYVYNNLLQVHDTTSIEEAAAMLLYNIAQTYVQRRQYENAIAWFDKSLHRFNKFHGGQISLSIAMNLHCMGYCIYRSRNKDQALAFYQRALEIVSQLQNLEDDTNKNSHLAASINCVGVVLFNQPSCNTEVVMEMFRKSLSLYYESSSCDGDMKDSNNHNHKKKSIGTVLNNIGRVHYLRSEFNEARVIYEECLQMRRTILGSMSIDVGATTYNLGQACYQLGRLDESLAHYKEFLHISTFAAHQAGNKSASRDIALVYKGIGEIYQDKSDCKMALYYFNQALQVYTACSPNGNPSTNVAAMRNRMGNLCYEMKDFTTAMAHYQAGLLVERAILEPNHGHIIITTTNIAHIHKQLGEYQTALATYQQVHKMQQSKFGDDSFVLAETMSSIGLMQYHLKQYEQSFDSYQQALRIRRQHLDGDDHPEIASTLNSIGLVLFKQEVFELAKNCFTESLRIRSKLFGKDHRDVAILWYNIGTIHFETGEDGLAIQMYKETLRVERRALGNDHPDVVLTLQHLGQVHQQLGFSEKAIGYFQEALDIERRREERVERSIASILNLLGNIYLQLGKTKEMMGCYVEASRIYESNRSLDETVVISGYNFYGLSKTNPLCAAVA